MTRGLVAVLVAAAAGSVSAPGLAAARSGQGPRCGAADGTVDVSYAIAHGAGTVDGVTLGGLAPDCSLPYVRVELHDGADELIEVVSRNVRTTRGGEVSLPLAPGVDAGAVTRVDVVLGGAPGERPAG